MREGGGEKWVGKHYTYILKIIKVKVALMLRQSRHSIPKVVELEMVIREIDFYLAPLPDPSSF